MGVFWGSVFYNVFVLAGVSFEDEIFTGSGIDELLNEL